MQNFKCCTFNIVMYNTKFYKKNTSCQVDNLVDILNTFRLNLRNLITALSAWHVISHVNNFMFNCLHVVKIHTVCIGLAPLSQNFTNIIVINNITISMFYIFIYFIVIDKKKLVLIKISIYWCRLGQ